MTEYKLSADVELTSGMIGKIIQSHKSNDLPGLSRMLKYYRGEHDILDRKQEDDSKPNNRLVHSFPQYISDIHSGYFMGEAVAYSSENQDMQTDIKAILEYNDEGEENIALEQDASIFGTAYELLYFDNDKQVRFKKVDARYAIPIYNDSIEAELLYFIRYYDVKDIENDKVITFAEVYDKAKKDIYIIDGDKAMPKELDIIHVFGVVPVAIYKNNDQQQGDFEQTISLIDAYNGLQSDGVNNSEAFCNSYLWISGFEGTESDDIKEMKNNRVLLGAIGTDAKWITKTPNGQDDETLKERISKNIYTFSKTPRLDDERFAMASGIAILWKMSSTENVAAKKERFFKKGLQRRLECICNALAATGGTSYNYLDIEIQFSRSVPKNQTDIANLLNVAGGLLSQETQINMLGLDIDAKDELAKRDAENAARVTLPFDSTGGDADGAE